MQIKRFRIFILIAMLLTLSLLTIGCTSTNQRVQEAMNKANEYTTIHLKGTGNTSIKLVSLGQNINIDYDFDLKSRDNNIALIMDAKANNMNTEMKMYMIGDQFLMYMPMFYEKYIDASDIMDEINKEAIAPDLSIFNFDVDNIELEPENTKINFNGEELNILKLKVLFKEDELDDFIKKVFKQQNVSSDALSTLRLQEVTTQYESLDLSTAEFYLYIDKKNEIKRYKLDAEFTLVMDGEVALVNMQMTYDLIETGDSIVVEMPDVNPEDVVSMSELM